MSEKNGSNGFAERPELFIKYRPSKLEEVIGQDSAVQVVQRWFEKKKVPHSILLTGSSGVGKTTIGRIIANKLGCIARDFSEVNSASFRGIESIRTVQKSMWLLPLGKSRVYLFDEIHQWSGDASNASLKILEDAPKHCYFILCTTNPQDLLDAIKTRCSAGALHLNDLKRKQLLVLVNDVLEKEEKELSEEVIDKVVDTAKGSARAALGILDKIVDLESEDEQLNAITCTDAAEQSIAIARALIYGRTTWADMAKILKNVDGDPEQIRWQVLGYANSVLLSGGKGAQRAFDVINVFRDPFYSSKKAGLTASCWELLGAK